MSSLQTFIRPNCQSDTVQTVRGVARISGLMGPQVILKVLGVWGGGSGCPPPHWGWGLGRAVTPPHNFFLNFYVKIVSFRAFWVAISDHLANCLMRIGNTPGIEIHCRSFQHFWNWAYNYSHPKIARQKMTKMHQKITIRNCAKITLFFLSCISVFILLKFLRVVDWGHGPQ